MGGQLDGLLSHWQPAFANKLMMMMMMMLVGFMGQEPLGMAALRNDGPSEWRPDTLPSKPGTPHQNGEDSKVKSNPNITLMAPQP